MNEFILSNCVISSVIICEFVRYYGPVHIVAVNFSGNSTIFKLYLFSFNDMETLFQCSKWNTIIVTLHPNHRNHQNPKKRLFYL